MKLSREHDRKLTQLIWRERMMKVARIAAVAAVLIAGAVYFNYQRQLRADPTLTVNSIEATVIEGTSRANRKGYIFHARMADGREIDAWASTGFAPPPGTHVLLAEGRHKSGKLSYELIRSVQ